MIGKAAAVVPHPGGAPLRLLCFDHPLAGPQIVKGTIRPEEPPLHAARRELWEEAGLTARSGLLLGQSADIVAGEIWHFALLRVAAPVPDRWGHLCQDDGGHIFQCRWQDVGAAAAFTGRFARAWTWIGQALQ